ncbi:hypothetical protein BJY52DRAFT_1231222 [Lactarius psammicola]|nr:hypothetical protein BJY52DRAFT_1231222 [Lactarius psammicola]
MHAQHVAHTRTRRDHSQKELARIALHSTECRMRKMGARELTGYVSQFEMLSDKAGLDTDDREALQAFESGLHPLLYLEVRARQPGTYQQWIEEVIKAQRRWDKKPQRPGEALEYADKGQDGRHEWSVEATRGDTTGATHHHEYARTGPALRKRRTTKTEQEKKLEELRKKAHEYHKKLRPRQTARRLTVEDVPQAPLGEISTPQPRALTPGEEEQLALYGPPDDTWGVPENLELQYPQAPPAEAREQYAGPAHTTGGDWQGEVAAARQELAEVKPWVEHQASPDAMDMLAGRARVAARLRGGAASPPEGGRDLMGTPWDCPNRHLPRVPRRRGRRRGRRGAQPQQEEEGPGGAEEYAGLYVPGEASEYAEGSSVATGRWTPSRVWGQDQEQDELYGPADTNGDANSEQEVEDTIGAPQGIYEDDDDSDRSHEWRFGSDNEDPPATAREEYDDYPELGWNIEDRNSNHGHDWGHGLNGTITGGPVGADPPPNLRPRRGDGRPETPPHVTRAVDEAWNAYLQREGRPAQPRYWAPRTTDEEDKSRWIDRAAQSTGTRYPGHFPLEEGQLEEEPFGDDQVWAAVLAQEERRHAEVMQQRAEYHGMSPSTDSRDEEEIERMLQDTQARMERLSLGPDERHLPGERLAYARTESEE